jgi:hypothetical protein
MLPDHLKPPTQKIWKLELLRQDLPAELFMKAITISPWAVIRVQEETRDYLRRQYPEMTEKDLWMSVIASRIEAILRNFGPSAPATVVQKLESLPEIMAEIHSWDDVLKFIFELNDELGDTLPDPFGLLDQINEMLAE